MTNERSPIRSPRPRQRGSLGLGIALAWGMALGVYLVAAPLAASLAHDRMAIFSALMMLPWLGEIALIVWFALRGEPRTSIGVVIGIGTMVLVVLLGLVALFGLLATSGFRG